MSDHVISGLVRRRRELTGLLFDHLERADVLAADIEALDRTLRLFIPDIELDAIPPLRSRPQPDWATRSEVVRIILEALRGAPEPLTVEAVTAIVHERRGLEGEPTALHRKRVRKCLDRQCTRGTIKRVHVNGLICWRV